MINSLATATTGNGLGDIVKTITTAVSDFLSGMGSSIVSFFDTAFINTDGSLTTMATVGLVMMGVGLAGGIVGMIVSAVKR